VKRLKVRFPLIEILWDDAATMVQGWEPADDIRLDEQMCVTVGFLVKETEQHLMIASTVDVDGNTNGRFQIPRQMVKSQRVVRKAN
jgi:hypothetical protein